MTSNGVIALILVYCNELDRFALVDDRPIAKYRSTVTVILDQN